MKTVARFVLLGFMGLFFCLWLYGAFQESLVRLFDTRNFFSSLVLLIAFSALCVSHQKFLMVGAAASVVYSVSSIIRFVGMLVALPSSATFRSVVGPWKFEGPLAHVVLWPPLIIVAIAGIAFIICQQDEWSEKSAASA